MENKFRPKTFLDGTPITDDYWNTLQEYMSDANDAQEQFTSEELENYARQMEKKGTKTKKEKE